MKILIYGIGGTMGKILYNCAQESTDIEVVCGVDKFAIPQNYQIPVYADCTSVKENVDCIIDFSVHSAVYDYLPYAVKNKVACVIASTGHTKEELDYIKENSKFIPILKSGNMSLGINLLLQISKFLAKSIGDIADIEIVEQHHNKKADAPSGTALLLADGIKSQLPESEYVLGRNGMSKRQPKEIGINAIRGGTIVGKHEVMFIMNNEIITLKHEAENKSVFAYGSLNAGRFIIKQSPNLYSMEDIYKD